jgi:hypothetical protein
MTIGVFCGNFGNFEENRPPQAVEFCVFTLFSRLPGVASPFDTGIIYISLQIEFSLVLYLKLRQFLRREQDERSRLRPARACRIVLLHGLLFK